MSNGQKEEKNRLCGIVFGDEIFEKEARILAAQLQVPVQSDSGHASCRSVYLRLDRDGLALQLGEQILRADFTGMQNRLRPGNLQREMLIKAVRIRGVSFPTVIDATAGLGEDSLILAAAGFRVQMYERDPVIAALLEDALKRASAYPDLSELVDRMTLYTEDSIHAMKSLREKPDVILLDPMFPVRQKSALVKKKFQLLHHLENPCEDEELLLQAALDAHPRKIVIKRPLKGVYLAGRKPDYSLKGKAIRYDCLVFAG